MKDLNTLYRPKKWAEVKGQDKIVKILKQQAISKIGLSNAYILTGSSGVGKTTIARLFFLALNCINLDKDGNPCLKCSPCTQTKFDLREINASNTRSIDEMREIIQEIYYKGTGSYKAILLDECHMLLKPSWNILLKPIEECPKHVIWFFCTTESTRIPKTIQTRCQVYRLGLIRWTDIHNRLAEIAKKASIFISDNDLWTIARNSAVNMRQAVHILEQYTTTNELKDIIDDVPSIDFLTGLAKFDLKMLWTALTTWEKKTCNLEPVLFKIRQDLGVVIKLKIGLPVQIIPFQRKIYEDLASKINLELLIKVYQQLTEIQAKISGVYDYNSLFLNMLCELQKK